MKSMFYIQSPFLLFVSTSDQMILSEDFIVASIMARFYLRLGHCSLVVKYLPNTRPWWSSSEHRPERVMTF